MTAPVNISWTPKGGSPTDISSYVDWTKIDCTAQITKERGTFQFYMLKTTTSAAYIPAVGDAVVLNDTSGAIFGGTVTETEVIIRGSQGGILLEYEITVTDYGWLLNSNLVKTSYANMDPADILADLVETYQPTGAGFNYTTYVQRGGFLVSTISFNYQELTQCIQQLCTQIGWDWNVDSEKNVHFFFATTETGTSEYYPAPFDIDDTEANINWVTLDIDVSILNMKNSVFVIGGTYAKQFITSPMAGANPPQYSPVDIYVGDGTRMVFPLLYKYSTSNIEVTLNGVLQTVGINQQQNPADYQVMYDTSGFLLFPSAIGSGVTVMVQGVAQVPIVAHLENPTSVAEYGEIQDSIINSQINSLAQAQELAAADLELYGHPIYDVKFDTLTPGLRIGMIIQLNSTHFGVTGYPLVIKKIEAVGYSPTALLYHVEAIGSEVVTLNDVLVSLLQNQVQNNPVDASTVIEEILPIYETPFVDDAVTISSSTRPYTFGSGKLALSRFS